MSAEADREVQLCRDTFDMWFAEQVQQGMPVELRRSTELIWAAAYTAGLKRGLAFGTNMARSGIREILDDAKRIAGESA